MNLLTLCSVKNSLFLFLLTSLLSGCQTPQKVSEQLPPNANTTKIIQGIYGKVIFKEGNFTPSGEIANNGKIYGVKRQIYFYELTALKDVKMGEGDFVNYISSEIMDSIYSDKNGNFNIELPEGKYSIIINESGRLYAKPDDKDYLNPISITQNVAKNVVIEIDYKAQYTQGQ